MEVETLVEAVMEYGSLNDHDRRDRLGMYESNAPNVRNAGY
jgi:hypothetical protein